MLYEIVLRAASLRSVATQKGANHEYLSVMREYCGALDALFQLNNVEDDDVEAVIGDDGTVHIIFYSPSFEFGCRNNAMPNLIERMQAFSVCDTGTDRGLEYECVFPSLWD